MGQLGTLCGLPLYHTTWLMALLFVLHTFPFTCHTIPPSMEFRYDPFIWKCQDNLMMGKLIISLQLFAPSVLLHSLYYWMLNLSFPCISTPNYYSPFHCANDLFLLSFPLGMTWIIYLELIQPFIGTCISLLHMIMESCHLGDPLRIIPFVPPRV